MATLGVAEMWTDGLDTRYLFFTGKGGVGKTSLASATALYLARKGLKTLIISTDPASNLDEVFQTALGSEPVPITEVPCLYAANLDPDTAARAYREKIVAPFRGKLPDAVIRGMEEQFSGACTTEIAAFDEFVRLMANTSIAATFERIVFDTAPTGHTLRLLSLPSAWSGFLNTTTAESSCLGPLAGLQDQRKLYAAALSRLSDSSLTTVILVAKPERQSLKEAARTQEELSDLGIHNQRLVVNAVYDPGKTLDPVAKAFASGVQFGLDSISERLRRIPIEHIPMLPGNVIGVNALEQLLSPVNVPLECGDVVTPPHVGMQFGQFVDELSESGSGVIMTMGKGGVGKTTIAVRISQELSARGHRVLLTTTDPAGNIEDLAGCMDTNLEVRRIDPVAEVSRYTAETLNHASLTLGPDALSLLEEDLRSPCTEEIAVFRAFADAVEQGLDRFVVIDTAPTGHTILLMDATESYHREVARTQSNAPESVRQLLPRLRDPDFTKVVIVTLPEPTPVHEAQHLQEDLRRAGIEPFGWIVNRSLALTSTSEPLLSARASQEVRYLDEVSKLASRTVVLPWTSSPTPPTPFA